MRIKYTLCIFSTAIGFHVCGSWHITKQNIKLKKLMQCPFVKSPFLSGDHFFPEKKFIMPFLFKNAKKSHFLNGFSTNSSKLLNGLTFNACILKSFTTKHSPKNSTHTPVFQIYMQIFKLCDKYYFVTNIFHMFTFFNIFWIFLNTWIT